MTATDVRIQHLDPDGLPQHPAFSQVVAVSGPVRTVYVGGQNGIGPDDALVGDDLATQTAQAYANLETALAAAGADLGDVVKWTIYAVDGHPIEPAFGVFQQVWGDRPNPPVITVVRVAGLAVPGALVEIDAIAAVPLEAPDA